VLGGQLLAPPQPLDLNVSPDGTVASRYDSEYCRYLIAAIYPQTQMPPSAMAMPGQTMSGAPAMVDPAYWGHQDFQHSDSTSPISPSLGLHLSPSTSITTQSSINGGTPPAQTPQYDGGKRNSTGGQKNSQKQSNSEQPRASVAVACVPCRSRHLKCDGGVRCSRCKTDNVECTYIKSRRGWKGKRKNKEENGAPAANNGGWTLSNMDFII
jgi:hypothetical protein